MAVIKVTLFPIVMIGMPSNIANSINFIPFYKGIEKTDILNIFLTVPFGFIIPFISKRKTMVITIIKGLIFSLSIEVLQLLEALLTGGFSLRIIDINDVIFNVVGVFVGYWVLYIIAKGVNKSARTPMNPFWGYCIEVFEIVKRK